MTNTGGDLHSTQFPSLLAEEDFLQTHPCTPLWGKRTYFAIVNACCSAYRHWRSIVGNGVENEWLKSVWLSLAGWYSSADLLSQVVRWLQHSARHLQACEQNFFARPLTSSPSAVKSPDCNGSCMRARLILRPRGCSASAVQAAI
jgi:hypothetical protein